jgi:ubiquinone/menaquinone biosynthesis C-methylase UbiE
MPVQQGSEPIGHQSVVNSHFTKATPYWADVYRRQDDVDAVIFQERLRRVLALVDGLALPPLSPVLEVGSGAGHATVALAKRGFVVEAIDAVQSMVDATRANAASAGVGASIKAGLGDVHALPFADASFKLVVAMGVLDWFPSMVQPIRQLARVLEPGGYSIVTMDNQWGLRQFVEPYTNPLLRPIKAVIKRLRGPSERNKDRALTYVASLRKTDATLREAGLEKMAGLTLGFGPFRLFNTPVLTDAAGLKIHRQLQRLCDRGIPLLRSSGGQYVVLARKRRE